MKRISKQLYYLKEDLMSNFVYIKSIGLALAITIASTVVIWWMLRVFKLIKGVVFSFNYENCIVTIFAGVIIGVLINLIQSRAREVKASLILEAFNLQQNIEDYKDRLK